MWKGEIVHCNYKDIMEQIGVFPIWFDEHAVPRYCDFHPKKLADIYAVECVFMEIACQGCGDRFKVAMSLNEIQKQMGINFEEHFPPHYGDPPNTECCAAGPTMNSEHVRVISRWKLSNLFDWEEVSL